MKKYGVTRSTAIAMMRRGDIPGAWQSRSKQWFAPAGEGDIAVEIDEARKAKE